ncbi:MAG: DDE-type integrase/transposase/recombinase [Chloroflexaceae bacterium]|nr:DDE-type integrase/transposase/recombinase [Chloroflexaceae bacterium]
MLAWLITIIIWLQLIVGDNSNADHDAIDLEAERQREAERRRALLGDLVNQPYDHERLRERARAVCVSTEVLARWYHTFLRGGIDALKPDWKTIPPSSWHIARERRQQLGSLADGTPITLDDIQQRAEELGWRWVRLKKWVERFRDHGIGALAPENDPEKERRQKKKRTIPDANALSEADLADAIQRLLLLGDLAEQAHVSEAEMQAQAQKSGKGRSTLWKWWSAYRDHGIAGLATRRRSDRGRSHNISDRMIDIVQGIRLSKRDCPVHEVHRLACERARLLGEEEPTEWQVRTICERIPKGDKLLADNRSREFANKCQITYPIHFKRVIYQVDITAVDVLVQDLRSKKYRTRSGEKRPQIITCIDGRSGVLVAARFTYDVPDRFDVGLVIRDALTVSERNHYGGIPEEIWIDRGRQFTSHYVKQLARELSFRLYETRNPNIKGAVERFFGTLNTRFWATLEGYTHANTVERNTEALKTEEKLTIYQLVERFWKFATETYHQTSFEYPDEAEAMTPLTYWEKHCFAEPANPDILQILLKEPFRRKVVKKGIKIEGRWFWHSELAEIVGEHVTVRIGTTYEKPEEIEVFHNDQWFCTAFWVASPQGQEVDPLEVYEAKKSQKRVIIRRYKRLSAGLSQTIPCRPI